MTARFDDTLFDNSYAEDDPLIQRLRSLDWPEVDPALRERCWADFQLQLENPEAARMRESERVPEVTRRSVARRQDFSRRLPGANTARLGEGLAGYASARWNWDRRPSLRVAALSG